MIEQKMTDEELISWVLQKQKSWENRHSHELPPIMDWVDFMKWKSPAWEAQESEADYRRGFTHGIAYAVELIDRLRGDGYIRPSEISNIIDNFNVNVLYPWRYRAFQDFSATEPARHNGHPMLKQEWWWNIRQRILKRDGKRCRDCGSTIKLQVDHIQPVCDGGLPHDDNLQALCKRCNMAKSTS